MPSAQDSCIITTAASAKTTKEVDEIKSRSLISLVGRVVR